MQTHTSIPSRRFHIPLHPPSHPTSPSPSAPVLSLLLLHPVRHETKVRSWKRACTAGSFRDAATHFVNCHTSPISNKRLRIFTYYALALPTYAVTYCALAPPTHAAAAMFRDMSSAPRRLPNHQQSMRFSLNHELRSRQARRLQRRGAALLLLRI